MAVPEIVQDSGWTNSPMHTATSQWQDDGKPTKGKIMSEQIVEVVKAVAWPVVVFALLVLFRHPLSKMLNDLGNRASRINIWKISVDLAVATPLPQPMSLRLSEIRDPVCALIDSDARRDLEALLGARPKADYAIVDLGTGDSWMTCRLLYSRSLWTIRSTYVAWSLLGLRMGLATCFRDWPRRRPFGADLKTTTVKL